MTRGIGDIDADFNDRGGDEDMQRPAAIGSWDADTPCHG